jgi:D-xylonolactonase
MAAALARQRRPLTGDWEVIVAAHDRLGESPLWAPSERALYWLDVTGGIVHRWDDHRGHEAVRVAAAGRLGAIALTAGSLVLTGRFGLAALDAATGGVRCLSDPLAGRTDVYLNDAKTDRAGRLWLTTADVAGTRPTGVLLRLDEDGVNIAGRGYAQGNGPAVSPDGTRLYVSESLHGVVWAYDLAADGALGTPTELLRLPPEEGVPDGLTVDSVGNLWVAHWGGGRVSCWSPEGTRLGVLPVPAPLVTSVAFGGVDLGTLFVTSARYGLGPDVLERWPLSGSLFAHRPGVTGLVETPMRSLPAA